jgi:hypothetical protein
MVSDYSQDERKFGDKVLPERFLKNLFSILRVVESSRINPAEIRVSDLNLQEVEIRTYDGPRIYFSLRFPSDQTLPVLISLTNRPDFRNFYSVDFRVENRTYYK